MHLLLFHVHTHTSPISETDSVAFGIVLLELITDLNGFESRKLFESEQTTADKLAAHHGAMSHHWQVGTLTQLSALIDRCCETKANRRCSVREIIPSLESLVSSANAHMGVAT
jgi:hypothetical protein